MAKTAARGKHDLSLKGKALTEAEVELQAFYAKLPPLPAAGGGPKVSKGSAKEDAGKGQSLAAKLGQGTGAAAGNLSAKDRVALYIQSTKGRKGGGAGVASIQPQAVQPQFPSLQGSGGGTSSGASAPPPPPPSGSTSTVPAKGGSDGDGETESAIMREKKAVLAKNLKRREELDRKAAATAAGGSSSVAGRPPPPAPPASATAAVATPEAGSSAAEPSQEERRKRARVQGVNTTTVAPNVSRVLDPDSFGAEDMIRSEDWDSREADEGLELRLPGFRVSGPDGRQTLVMRVTVPKESETWCISICPKHHEMDEMKFQHVLYHFNPRARERGGTLVQNDRKASTWGRATNCPLSKLERQFEIAPMFNNTLDLAVQVDSRAFHVAIDGLYWESFLHRTPLEDWAHEEELVLEIPEADEYRKKQKCVVHQIWWGNKKRIPGLPSVEEFDRRIGATSAGGGPQSNTVHVSGLPRLESRDEEEGLVSKLKEVFGAYGEVDKVRCFGSKGYAFVYLGTPEQANHACEKNGQPMSEEDPDHILNVTIARPKLRRQQHEAP